MATQTRPIPMHTDPLPPAQLQRINTAPMPLALAAGNGTTVPSSKAARTQSANISGHVTNHSLANGQAYPQTHAQPQAHSQSAHTQAAHKSSNHSMQSASISQGSSRSSDTTQGTAASTLFPPPLPNGAAAVAVAGEVTATDNVMNSVADASSSLFQICVTLRQRLVAVPGFSESLYEVEAAAASDDDPVSVLWRVFRRGYTLILLYNTLLPDHPLSSPTNVSEGKVAKASTFKFLQACITDLKFPQEECFIISDLYGDDTTGFVKVVRVVNRVLDILVQRGLIDDLRSSDLEQTEQSTKRTQRQHIISELVATERTYVSHLELLQKFKQLVEEKGAVSGDAIHDIFFNLSNLLNFQRRFLIRVEQTNGYAEAEQNWGKLFVMHYEAFKVYEQYIANQRKCERTVLSAFPALASTALASGTPEIRSLTESATNLHGFLMKPFQRLSKYPLLLDDLYKKGDLDEQRRADLLLGREAMTSVLAAINRVVDRQEKAEAVGELEGRVEDWKGHQVRTFGELLLYGTFTVLKGEGLGGGGGKEGERNYHVYLFDNILLCCKDIDLSKSKNKLSNRQLTDKRGKPKIQLKGRIFMSNVTDVLQVAKPGSYTCQIFWTGDPSIENFVIRFTTEEMMKKWAAQIEAQRRIHRVGGVRGSGLDGNGGNSGRWTGTSATEFEYMRAQGVMENPYAEGEEYGRSVGEEERGSINYASTIVGGESMMGQGSRNGSFTSLMTGGRSRSRGDSISRQQQQLQYQQHYQQQYPQPTTSRTYPPANGHAYPQQGQQQQPSLTLRTRELSSPQQGHGINHPDLPLESYFSPIDGSPSTIASSRTSGASGMFAAFPPPTMTQQQQYRVTANGTPLGGYADEQGQYTHIGTNSSRFTAPAVARRGVERESSGMSSSSSTSSHPQRGAADYSSHTTRPSGGPAPMSRPSAMGTGQGAGMHSSAQLPPRNRSVSSPDIHHQISRPPSAPAGGMGVGVPGGGGMPPIPLLPATYALGSRSQTGSPALGRGVGNVSPQMLRERAGYGGATTPTPPQGQGYGGGYGSLSPPPAPPTMSQGAPARPLSSEQHYHLQQQQQQQQQTAPTTATPPQLKVKVNCTQISPSTSSTTTLTLVVPANISYTSLRDRIDAKLQRSTGVSLSERAAPSEGGGPGAEVVKLKFRDEGDMVSIQSDEDVAEAFESCWREVAVGQGGLGEVELFCMR